MADIPLAAVIAAAPTASIVSAASAPITLVSLHNRVSALENTAAIQVTGTISNFDAKAVAMFKKAWAWIKAKRHWFALAIGLGIGMLFGGAIVDMVKDASGVVASIPRTK